jgi:hypothetical protein
MPLIRSSQEVYNYLKRKSGETGEPMSIILDRWMVKELHDGRGKDTKRKDAGSRGKPGKAGGRSRKSKTLAGVVTDSAKDFDHWFSKGS